MLGVENMYLIDILGKSWSPTSFDSTSRLFFLFILFYFIFITEKYRQSQDVVFYFQKK